RGDARRIGAVGSVEAADSDLPRVFHGMGRERRCEVRRRRVRIRPQADRAQLRATVCAILLASSVYGGVPRGTAAAGRPSSFDTNAADFALAFAGESAAYRELSTFVLPGARLSLEAVGGPPGDYTASATAGTLI